jgi:hypothetical protein
MGCEPRRRVHRRISREVTPRTTGHEARPTHERPRLLASGQRGDDDASRTGTPAREGPGRARRGRPNCLLFSNSVVRHTTKCGSGTESPRTWNPLEEGSLREADARVARRRGRRTQDGPPDRHRRESKRRRIGVVKSIRARGGCLGVIRTTWAWKAAISPGELLYERRSRNARGRPGELKHLSTRRRRNQHETPSVAASERGPA